MTHIVSPKSISPIPSEEPVDVQKQMMNLSKTTNEDKCRTIECLEKIEAAKTSSLDFKMWKQKCYNAMKDDFNTPVLTQIFINASLFLYISPSAMASTIAWLPMDRGNSLSIAPV